MTESADPTNRPGRPLRSSSFKYYIHDGVAACRLQLIGELTELDLGELNGCWRTAKTTLGGRPLILDLNALESVDDAGKQWLASMMQEGVTCLPEQYLRDLVAGRHIAGAQPPPKVAKSGLIGRIVALIRGTGVAAAK